MTECKARNDNQHKRNISNKNWIEYRITQLGYVYPGLKGKNKDDFGKGKKFISYMNVYSNPKISLSIKDLVDVKDVESQNKVRYGDIFFTTSSETPDEVAMSSVLLEENIGEVYLNSFCIGYRLNNFDILLPEFAQFYFRGINFRKQITRIAQGAIRYNLSKKYFLEEKITIPTIQEQKQIVSVVRKWDKYIEFLDQKIQTKKDIKKYLQQVLLTGKVRLRDFKDKWQEVKLGYISSLCKGKAIKISNSKSGNYPVIAGGKTSPYNYVEYNYEKVLTVSASGANAGFVSFHPNKIWASDCSVIKAIDNVTDILYLKYLLELKQSLIYTFQSGGAQPHVYPKDLAIIKLSLPSILEQKAISSILSKSDEEISMLEKQKDIIEEQKKYLLNNLVTGKIRLPKFRNNK